MEQVRRVELLPKQMQFCTCNARRVLYSGAFGAGKSFAIAAKVAQRASHPGAREGLCRKTLESLKKTTLKTLLEGDGEIPPLLPVGTYTHNKSEKTIRLNNGGEILYFGLDAVSGATQSKIGSLNLSGCGIDEWVELTERETIELGGRIRVQVPGLVNQLYGGCNPSTPSHFLARDFGLALDYQCKEDHEAIRTRTPDNFTLQADYVEDLSRMTGLMRKRFYEGLWVGSEGLVYDRWDRERHVMVLDDSFDETRRVLALDDGFTNPFVLLVLQVDGDGRVHLRHEHYGRRMSVPEKLGVVREHYSDGDEVVCDPSAAQLIAAMRDDGIEATGARRGVMDRGTGKREAQDALHGVLAGIARMSAYLEDPGDGMPRLTVHPDCVNFIREMESYEWEENRQALGDDVYKDKPKKENDHGLDACRYGITHLDRAGYVGAVVARPNQEETQTDKPKKSVRVLFQEKRADSNWGF